MCPGKIFFIFIFLPLYVKRSSKDLILFTLIKKAVLLFIYFLNLSIVVNFPCLLLFLFLAGNDFCEFSNAAQACSDMFTPGLLVHFSILLDALRRCDVIITSLFGKSTSSLTNTKHDAEPLKMTFSPGNNFLM